MSAGLGVGAPQGQPGEAPIHDHEHAVGRRGEFDRQRRFAVAKPAHRRIDLRVNTGLGQRHHSHLGKPSVLAARVLHPAELPPVGLGLRRVQHEAVHCGPAHPPVEGALQTIGGQRPGQHPEDRFQSLGFQTPASPDEGGLVRDTAAQLRYATDQVLSHVVVEVLLEQGQGEREVDREPGRQRAGLLVANATLLQRLDNKLRGHPPAHRPQPHMIG